MQKCVCVLSLCFICMFSALDAQESMSPLQQKQQELQEVERLLSTARTHQKEKEEALNQQREAKEQASQALIQTALLVQEAEQNLLSTEEKLSLAQEKEANIRNILDQRREILAHVFAALQRMSRKPPPAVLVHPEDMLQAVRASILLGDVVPHLRRKMEEVRQDLSALILARQELADQKKAFQARSQELHAQRNALSQLLEMRKSQEASLRKSLEGESARLQALVQQTSDLKDLLTRMEAETRRRSPDMSLRFEPRRALLHLPVTGDIIRSFKQSDGFGGIEKGLSLRTKPEALVTSPLDARVIFAGPYRAYGHLLILSVGNGYHMVLAGLGRTDVLAGQNIKAGEPLGAMGHENMRTTPSLSVGTALPVLYIECRKEGIVVDSTSWWIVSDLKKAGR